MLPSNEITTFSFWSLFINFRLPVCRTTLRETSGMVLWWWDIYFFLMFISKIYINSANQMSLVYLLSPFSCKLSCPHYLKHYFKSVRSTKVPNSLKAHISCKIKLNLTLYAEKIWDSTYACIVPLLWNFWVILNIARSSW